MITLSFGNLSCSYAWVFNSRENNALLCWAYLHISFLTAYFKVKAIKHISGKANYFTGFNSRLSSINSCGYNFGDIHNFSGYNRQEILDKYKGDLLGYCVIHWPNIFILFLWVRLLS